MSSVFSWSLPEDALVLCCVEKSQAQALDRTQPGVPLKPGRAATVTHDYKRYGTTTLFAAMSTFDGTTISRCEQLHRHVEWLDFCARSTVKRRRTRVCI